jgi:hypothetical protein
MFITLQITLLGRQPIAKISDRTLERLISRDFGINANEVKQKLLKVNSTPNGKNRISAAILKLANKDVNAIYKLIEGNNDFRDIVINAEYPRCAKLGFDTIKKSVMKQIYLEDWKEYSTWLNKP